LHLIKVKYSVDFTINNIFPVNVSMQYELELKPEWIVLLDFISGMDLSDQLQSHHKHPV